MTTYPQHIGTVSYVMQKPGDPLEGLPFVKYDVWREGYCATGEQDGAKFLGVSHGRSFREACDLLLMSDSTYQNGRWWSCRLFDNEVDARKAFG